MGDKASGRNTSFGRRGPGSPRCAGCFRTCGRSPRRPPLHTCDERRAGATSCLPRHKPLVGTQPSWPACGVGRDTPPARCGAGQTRGFGRLRSGATHGIARRCAGSDPERSPLWRGQRGLGRRRCDDLVQACIDAEAGGPRVSWQDAQDTQEWQRREALFVKRGLHGLTTSAVLRDAARALRFDSSLVCVCVCLSTSGLARTSRPPNKNESDCQWR